MINLGNFVNNLMAFTNGVMDASKLGGTVLLSKVASDSSNNAS